MKNFKAAAPIWLLLLCMVILCGCEKDGLQTGETSPPLSAAKVKVAKVSRQIAVQQVELVGNVQAVDRAEISSKISGNIVALPVELGTRINSGDLLVEISAEEISARLQQARAQLEQAERNLAREEKLLKKEAATRQTVKSLEDTVKIARASFLEAETMLNYTRITAPFSGIVTAKFVSTGDMAAPGKPLLQIERENKLQIQSDIPEALVHLIHKGDRLWAYIPAVDVKVLGEVTELSPVADPSSRTTPIKLRIEAKPHLRSGQFARVALALEKAETLSIPVSAVVPYGQMDRVFVVDNGRARLRLIRTGAIQESDNNQQNVEILSGLSENEVVVVSGNLNLVNGQPLIVE